MMKSFFKKLAFVMALAMVVTAMAPAATASAAETLGIALQTATSKTEVKTADNVAVGATVDYKYYGAPANYMDLEPTWSTSDPKIAEVTQKGEVTGVADGVATITIALNDGTKGTIEITVGKGAEASKAFEVKQTTSNAVEITFADAKSATKDITVTKLGKTTSGEVTKIVWPVNKVEVKDNVATVTTWVDFGTGSYRFTANGVDVDKDTAVGYPEFAVITYKDTYTYAENGNKAATPEITVYDAKGVKLTGYTNWYFELLNTDANAYVENTTGNLYLWNVGAVANIKATLTYVVGTETKTVECPVKVECVAKPPYTVNNYIEQYALATTTTAAKDIVWGKTDVIINDGNYNVVALLKDSLDKTVSLTDKSVNGDKNPQVVGYYAKYASSNPTVALVDELNGVVLGVNEGSAYVLVTLFKKDATDSTKDQNLGVIAAIPVTVKPARKATVITLDKYSDTLLTSGDFAETTVTVTVKDQHNGDQSGAIDSVYAKVNDVVYSNTTKPAGSDKTYVTISGNKFTIDAKQFAEANLNSITFEVKTKNGLKANYVLSLKKLPELVNQMYALNVDGANVALGDDFDGTANVKVVSAWAGSNLYKTDFYYGKPANCKVGDLYVTIAGPDGKDLATQAGTHAALEFKAIKSNTATPEALKVMATGTYVVKLQQVTQVATGSDNKQIVNTVTWDTKTFEVKNSLPGVTGFAIKSSKYTTSPITVDTVEFKVNDIAWDGSNYAIDNINSRELAGSVFVYDFTVRIPYGTEGAYYTKKITVNQLFTK